MRGRLGARQESRENAKAARVAAQRGIHAVLDGHGEAAGRAGANPYGAVCRRSGYSRKLAAFLSLATLKFVRTAFAHADKASSRPPATAIVLTSSCCTTRLSKVAASKVLLPFSQLDWLLPIPKLEIYSAAVINPELLAGDPLAVAKRTNLVNLVVDIGRQLIPALKDRCVRGRP